MPPPPPHNAAGDTNGNSVRREKCLSWEEIREHTAHNDRWMVIEGRVYDITQWQKKHPGGGRILGHYAGQDATDAFQAMHNDKTAVRKYLKALQVGVLKDQHQTSVMRDFRALEAAAHEKGLYKVNPVFYILQILHILLLEVIGYSILRYHGDVTITSFLLASCCLATAQAQAGWTQHDYGHLSVFNSSLLNHAAHQLTIGFLKGASSHWWNFRHFQHHVKPNVHKKDPDITVPYVFLLGDKIPVTWGEQKRGYMPYERQHAYFWVFGPLTLLTVYFHIEIIYFTIKRRDWLDLFWIGMFFARLFWFFEPILGVAGSLGLYFFVRTLESFWFTFVTQMSHIPMAVDKDQDHDWVKSQAIATCNVEPGVFNDWFTGHLNYQLEHHFFPMMPRHNYHKMVAPTKALLKKHNLPYTVKSLHTAFADILRSLSKSGKLWYDAYHHD